MKSPMKPILAAAAICMASCTPLSELPPELLYPRSTAGMHQISYIRGSLQKSPVPFFDDHTTFVQTIDGRMVNRYNDRWADNVPAEAGQHTIHVKYGQGAYGAETDFELHMRPSRKYEARSRKAGRGTVDFWIVDQQTQCAVTGVKNVGIKNSFPNAFIPIVLPAG